MNVSPEQTPTEPPSMPTRSRTRRRAPLIAGRALAVALLGCSFGCAQESGPWMTGWRQVESGVEFRVDPDFTHEGPTWVHGIGQPSEAVLEFAARENGEMTLRFRAGEWYAGHIFWIVRGAGDELEAGAWMYSDLVVPIEIRDPSGFDLRGRVLLSSTDWEAGDPVHCQIGVRYRDEDGEEFELRASGTAVLPPDEGGLEQGPFAGVEVPETDGLNRLSDWTRDTQCYQDGVEILVDPDYRCEYPDWMETPADLDGGPRPAHLYYLDDPVPRLRADDGRLSPTELLLTLFENDRIIVEATQEYDFYGIDGPVEPVGINPRGRLLISTAHWEQVDEVHLEYQFVCGPPDEPYIVRGAGSAYTKD